MNKIGERLQALRKQFGYSQNDVAEFIGVSRSTYAGYETGNSKPIRKVNEIANLYSVSIDYILCRTDNKTILLPTLLTKTKIMTF